MHIMLAEFELRLPGVHSLKEKRSIVKRLLNEIRRDYNVSAAEVDHLDAWQSCVIAVVMVGGLKEPMERTERALGDLLDGHPAVEVCHSGSQWL